VKRIAGLLLGLCPYFLYAGTFSRIGQDGRTVADTSKYPHSAIGLIKIRKSDKSFGHCTGSLVAPQIVLTNAHCLYNARTKTRYSDVTFYPGYSKEQSPYGQAKIKKVYIADEYINEGNKYYDYAFVVLDKSLGDEAGWLGIRKYVHQKYREQNNLILSGYASNFVENPFKSDIQTTNSETCSSKQLADGKNEKEAVLFTHDCDTGQGSSGSPVYIKAKDKFYIVGLNAGGWGPRGKYRMQACEEYIFNECGNYAVLSNRFVDDFKYVQNKIRSPLEI